MKTKLFIIICFFFLASCSSTVSLVNDTDNTITSVSILTLEQRGNFELFIDEITEKNVLKSKLQPGEKAKLKKENNVSILATSENYYYFIENVNDKSVKIDESSVVDYDFFAPMIDPDIIKMQIENNSKYYINEIELEIKDKCGPKKIRTKNALEFWNVIHPNKQINLRYAYYPPCPYELKSITVKGFLGNQVFEKKFTENLDKLIITD